MTNYGNNQSCDWHELVYQELISHRRLIERLLTQMRIRYRYEPDGIVSQIFIDIQHKVETGRIVVEYADDCSSTNFVCCNRAGERSRIASVNAYFRVIIVNHVRKLYLLEKKGDILVDPGTLEYFDLLSYIPDDLCDYDDNTRFSIVREKLKLLSLDDHKILELFFFHNLSYEEIAECLKSSCIPPDGHRPYNVNTLRQKKLRALAKLRKLF